MRIHENPASNKLVYEIQPEIFCLASECTHTIKIVVNMASVGRWKDFRELIKLLDYFELFR